MKVQIIAHFFSIYYLQIDFIFFVPQIIPMIFCYYIFHIRRENVITIKPYNGSN